jgi:hypothetical protein
MFNNSMPDFFTPKEFRLFKKVAKTKYDKKNPDDVKNRKLIYSTLFKKTNFWAENIVPKGFALKKDTWPFLNNYRHMVFKGYTWARIYRIKDEGKFIFFTFGVDAKDMTLVYKIDCQWNDKKRFLDNIQVEKFRDRIKDSPARRFDIKISDLKNYDWERLLHTTKAFISDYTKLYDEIIKYVWDDKIKTTNFRNTLILREPPSAQKFKGKSKKSKPSGIDYNKRNKENKILGDFGEKMVKLYEIKSLKIANRSDLIDKVDKVKDGEGYDIISYDKYGKEKYIEVKTTKGNNLTNFPISANEFNFLKNNKRNAFIYRVYNAKPKKKLAEYFIMDYKKLNDLFICEDLSYIMKKK